MKNRLIELLEETLEDWECDVQSKTISQIAEHLIENGTVVLPCTVGDVLYDIYDREIVREMKVMETNIRFDKRNKPWLIIGGYYFAFEDFGKTVFLTKEEAVQGLKGGEG